MNVYFWIEATPITTAWIYHDEVNGLISLSSDGNTWITIADKNLWATTVYNSWDTTSETNCWTFFQRWNNYGFPFTWATTTTTTKVNAWTYWPWNYYSGSTFIKVSNWNWDSSNNNNLRWDTTDTLVARQWPCVSGFHVPTQAECISLVNAWVSMWAWTSSGANDCVTLLKIWYWWYLGSNTGTKTELWNHAVFWTSSYSTTWQSYGFRIISWSAIQTNLSWARAFWYQIRPFANTPVQPDDSWTVLYQPS